MTVFGPLYCLIAHRLGSYPVDEPLLELCYLVYVSVSVRLSIIRVIALTRAGNEQVPERTSSRVYRSHSTEVTELSTNNTLSLDRVHLFCSLPFSQTPPFELPDTQLLTLRAFSSFGRPAEPGALGAAAGALDRLLARLGRNDSDNGVAVRSSSSSTASSSSSSSARSDSSHVSRFRARLGAYLEVNRRL